MNFWTDIAPLIVLVLVAVWGFVMPATVVYLLIKHVRENETARRIALRELSDAISDNAPSDESRHQPLGQLVPLWPARHRHDEGGAA